MTHEPALPIRRGLTYIAIAAVAWGVGGFVAAILYRTSGLGPIAVSFWRFVGGAALLGAARWSRPGRWRVGPGRLILTGVGFAIYQTAYYAAIGLVGLALGTVVTLGAGPVLIAIGGRLFLGERLDPAVLVTSLVGLVLLVGTGDGHAGPRPALGVATALLSAAGYAGVTLLSRGRTRVAGGSTLDNALGGFVVGACCLLPLALAEGLLPSRGDLGLTLGLLAFLGAVPTALGYALFFSGLTAVRATTSSIIALVEPLAAAVLGVWVLGERLGVLSALGAALLLASVGALALGERRVAAATQ